MLRRPLPQMTASHPLLRKFNLDILAIWLANDVTEMETASKLNYGRAVIQKI